MILRERIPISIHPFFWIFAALIGWMFSQTLVGTLLWVGIIVVSVVFHEFGHALTAVLFGQKAQIRLVALGGLTSYDGPPLKFWQQFIIVLNGPIAGFILSLIAALLLMLPVGHGVLFVVLTWTKMANLFWSVVNLLPVLPLDGGQLLRIALEGTFGVKGFRASLLIGVVAATLLCIVGFLAGQIFIGALFFLFAFQSFDYWRKSRFASLTDREDEFRKMLSHAEDALLQGKKSEAVSLLQELKKRADGGMLGSAASQTLALLYADEGKEKEAYEMLLPLKEQLTDQALCLLHRLASDMGNQAVVADLSSPCYQFAPTREVAIRNARAFAALNQSEAAGGWLQTALRHGAFDLKPLLEDAVFDSVRSDPLFRKFLEPL